MFFSVRTIALTAALLSTASAAPLEPTGVALEARQQFPNEGIYLVNCQGGNGGVQSQMNYYRNARSGSQHGEMPDSVATITRGTRVTWEGQAVNGNFAGGGSATSLIDAGAQNRAVGQRAGTARNSFGQNFNCFRDNNRVLHTGSGDPNFSCNSIYYCYDA